MPAYAMRTSAGPIELDPNLPFTLGKGDDAITYLPPTLVARSAAELWALGIPEIVGPGPAPDGKVVTGTTWGNDTGGPTIPRVWVIADTPPPTKTDLSAYAVNRRNALRDSGITIGGMAIQTDLNSQNLISGAYQLSQNQPDGDIDFKTATGWVTVDASMLQTIAIAVGRWVQACYSANKAVDAQIAAGTITTTDQIDAAFAAVTLPG
jgi:hypothetical protein